MPVATLLLRCRVTPNQVLLTGVVLTLATAALIVDGQVLLAGVLLECKVGIMTRAERVLLVAFGLMSGCCRRRSTCWSR